MTNKLINSPHVLAVGNVILYFNTEKAMQKFMLERDQVLKETNAKLMNIYKGLFNLDVETLSDIRLYHKINTRGFLVKHSNEFFNSLDEMQFKLDKINKI